MSMFERFFKEKPKQKVDANAEKPPELDRVEIEFNRKGTQIERDAMRAESITKFLTKHIEDLIKNKPEIFYTEMPLEEAINRLKDESENPEFSIIKLQIEHFLILFPDKDILTNTLYNFLEILRKREIRSEQVLHPEKYTNFHHEI